MKNKPFGWYCSDGEHKGSFTTYESETYSWKEVIPLYKKIHS